MNGRHVFIFSIYIMVSIVSALSSAHAADVRCVISMKEDLSKEKKDKLGLEPDFSFQGRCIGYEIRGEITAGDFGKVAYALSSSFLLAPKFYMNSPGGDVYEAMKIGRLFRKYLIRAKAPMSTPIGQALFSPESEEKLLCVGENCLCASSCALIWFGAVERSGIIGLHRPKILGEYYKNSSPREASNLYNETLADIRKYLVEMEAPNPVIDAMVSTASYEIKWVEADEKLKYPPAFAEWITTSCGPYPEQELAMAYKLLYNNKTPSPEDEVVGRSLENLGIDYTYCSEQLKIKHLRSMYPPFKQ